MSRSLERATEMFSDAVDVVAGDLELLDEASLTELLGPFDGLVYAAGADERITPDGDAAEFFHHENVELCRKVLSAAQETEISHVVLLNSILAYLDRVRPELKLAEHHTYIASRVEQRKMALAAAEDHFILTVLEVPWVFGFSGDRESQWVDLVKYARTSTPLVSLRGGTVAISARNVGRATVGALTRPTESSCLPIGDCNISWNDLLQKLRTLSGRSATKVVQVPGTVFAGVGAVGSLGQRLFGVQSGLDFSKMHEFLAEEMYIEPTESQRLLGFEEESIDVALADTVRSVPETRVSSGLRKLDNAIRRRGATKTDQT